MRNFCDHACKKAAILGSNKVYNSAYHKSVDRINHRITVCVIAGCEQFGGADGIGISTHTAKQHHSLELKKSCDKKE
jgi:hypothetical protein